MSGWAGGGSAPIGKPRQDRFKELVKAAENDRRRGDRARGGTVPCRPGLENAVLRGKANRRQGVRCRCHRGEHDRRNRYEDNQNDEPSHVTLLSLDDASASVTHASDLRIAGFARPTPCG
jgi:hypothetical protein